MYHLERKRIFTLTADYFTFASLTTVPRLEATVFMNREQIQRLMHIVYEVGVTHLRTTYIPSPS